MPQRGETDPDGSMHSDHLASRPSKLPEEDIQPFLENLLTDIARRPERMKVRETAGVVRFLRLLAQLGVPADLAGSDGKAIAQYRREEPPESRKARSRVDNLAVTIWNVLLQTGDLPTAKAHTAIGFLKRNRETFLGHFDVEEAIEVIRSLRVPATAEDPFQPPHLISRTTTSTGEGNPHLGSDLTEKIYIAYHFLKRHNVQGAQGRIATTLDDLSVPQERTDRGWNYADVNERVKQHRKRLRERLRGPTEEAVRKWTDYLVDLQITSFLGQRDVARRNEQRQRAIDRRGEEPNARTP